MTLITAEGVSLELGTGWRSGSKKWNGGANGPRQMFDMIQYRNVTDDGGGEQRWRAGGG